MNFFDIIPPDHMQAVRSALQETFGTNEVTGFSVLSGGLSAASTYRFTVSEKPYVLKLTEPTFNEIKVSTANLLLAAEAGIAPALHYLDNSSGISITDHITTQPLRNVFEPDELTAKLASAVKTLHAIPSDNDGPYLFDTVDTLVNEFKQTAILSGPVFDECFANYETLKSKLKLPKSDKVFSHNDLNPNNILCDGERIWIIDWDTANLNDRYIDLTNLANFFVHTEDQENAYLTLYFDGNVDEYKKARFFTMRQICRLVYAMLMFKLAGQQKPVDHFHNQEMKGIDLGGFFALMGKGELSLATYEGQLMYGKALLNTAVHQMRSDRWKASLAQFN